MYKQKHDNLDNVMALYVTTLNKVILYEPYTWYTGIRNGFLQYNTTRTKGWEKKDRQKDCNIDNHRRALIVSSMQGPRGDGSSLTSEAWQFCMHMHHATWITRVACVVRMQSPPFSP